jgi:hypothetical protein
VSDPEDILQLMMVDEEALSLLVTPSVGRSRSRVGGFTLELDERYHPGCLVGAYACDLNALTIFKDNSLSQPTGGLGEPV